MYISIDHVGYDKKPQSTEVGNISKRLPWKWGDHPDMNEVCKSITIDGKSFLLVKFQPATRLAKYAVEFSGWALDFDGTICLSEFMTRARDIKPLPTIVYPTFSQPRTTTGWTTYFRAMYLIHGVSTDLEIWQRVQTHLLEQYPEADRVCKDITRLYFGGTQGTVHQDIQSMVVNTAALKRL